MTEIQAASGASGASMEQPDPSGEDANSEAGATNGAVGRASIPAEDAATAPTPTPKFTRPPGMPAPPDSLDDATRPDGGTPGPAPLAPTETTGSVTASAKVPQSSGRAAVNLSVPTSGIGSPGGYGGSGFHSSGSGATSVLGAAGTGTIPTRPGAPGVPDGGRSAAARATTLGRASTARVAEAVRSARSTVAAATRGPRRARLFVKRIDPWSVMKFAFAVSFVLFFVAIIATTVLYLALDAMGVFDSLNKTIADMLGATGGKSTFKITALGVIGTAGVLGLVNVVLFTALATLGAFIYNVCADLVGGIEVTLSEKD